MRRRTRLQQLRLEAHTDLPVFKDLPEENRAEAILLLVEMIREHARRERTGLGKGAGRE